jgi:hypothetical protein
MFPLNTILAWNINIIMNKKYDNNNIIIASRAYFLQPCDVAMNGVVGVCIRLAWMVCSCGWWRENEKQMTFVLSVRFCAPGKKSHVFYSKSNGGWWVYSYHRW